MASTNHTKNYSLSQWAAGDPVLRADFNADNLAIDTALTALNSSKGNARIKYGTYIGTGTYGSSGQSSLTITEFVPNVIILVHLNTDNISLNSPVLCVRPATMAHNVLRGTSMYLTWGTNTLSWYTNQSGAYYQFNTAGDTYAYVALG